MNTDTKILYFDLSYAIRGAVYSVANNYGKGLKEIIYQKALAEELTRRHIPFEREKRVVVKSLESEKVLGTYIPDFVIDEKIILEIKATEFTTKSNVEQRLSYLKSSEYEVSFLVNFGTPRLYIKRTIFTNNRKHIRVNP